MVVGTTQKGEQKEDEENGRSGKACCSPMLETVRLGPTMQVEGFALASNGDSSFPEKEGKQVIFEPIQVDG